MISEKDSRYIQRKPWPYKHFSEHRLLSRLYLYYMLINFGFVFSSWYWTSNMCLNFDLHSPSDLQDLQIYKILRCTKSFDIQTRSICKLARYTNSLDLINNTSKDVFKQIQKNKYIQNIFKLYPILFKIYSICKYRYRYDYV